LRRHKGQAVARRRSRHRRLYALNMERIETEEDAIRAYVLSQLPKVLEKVRPREQVKHAERVATKHIYGSAYDIWDVWTTKDRWWVITNPTNLYNQRDFVSMEMAYVYHVGLGWVMAHRNAPPEEDDELLRIAGPLRLWQRARDELDSAIEAEDFQTIGMRCREALLGMARVFADSDFVPKGSEVPKAGDFVHWAEYIASHALPGSSVEDLRSHLKSTARTTWAMAGWLTHAKNATRSDAHVVVDATEHTLEIYLTAVLGSEREERARCHVCGSYRVWPEYDPVERRHTGRITRCEACGYGMPKQ
jgi:hypothetical protein